MLDSSTLTTNTYLLENTLGFSTGKKDISIGVYNINTLNSDKLKVTIELMQKCNIDIIILIDTRASKDAAQHFSSQARDMLGQGCYVASHPVEPAAALNTQTTKRVGRQMILAKPTWGEAIIKSSADRSGPGILTATTIRTASTDILLLGTHWPIPHNTDEHSQSLTTHLQNYMKK